MATQRWRRGARWLLAAGALMSTGCAASMRPFPLVEPMWSDDDAHPYPGEPEEYYSSFMWDGADQMVFRPIARFWAVDPGGASVNVNAWDEVPDSSWFQNRIGRFSMTPEAVRVGRCDTPPLDPTQTWTATAAKPNGANPGFIIKGHDGRGYLLKFDGLTQGPRATAADTIVSKLYHAAGYHVPCNRIVFFDRSIIEIAPDAKSENEVGEKVPMTEADLEKVFAKALRLPDGRYRGSSSLFLPGKPIGPFRYEGTRDDDPNDVIPHEDRRELRGNKIIAAWTGHTDSREQNSLDMWIETAESQGFIRHHMIDFGDCLGSIWEPPMMGRRIQHSAYFDGPEIFEDWITLGLIQRPWDRLRFGPSGKVWAYFDIEEFHPEDWEPGYPNPAMLRMTEADGAWMARILAKISDAHLRAAIGAGKIQDDFLEGEIFRLLKGRKTKLLGRWLTRLSALAWPRLDGDRLCLDDLAVEAGVIPAALRKPSAAAWVATGVDYQGDVKSIARPPVSTPEPTKVCVDLSHQPGASEEQPAYVIVDVYAGGGSAERVPLRLHLYDLGSRFVAAGLERPEDRAPPGS